MAEPTGEDILGEFAPQIGGVEEGEGQFQFPPAEAVGVAAPQTDVPETILSGAALDAVFVFALIVWYQRINRSSS